MDKLTEIWTDGSCGGKADGGCAAVIRHGHYQLEIAYRHPRSTTNNQMEIMAVICALEQLTRPCRVRIYTDSQYVIKITKPTANVKKNRKMRDRMMKLLAMHTSTEFFWVKGHNGDRYNERADKLAKMGRLSKKPAGIIFKERKKLS